MELGLGWLREIWLVNGSDREGKVKNNHCTAFSSVVSYIVLRGPYFNLKL